MFPLQPPAPPRIDASTLRPRRLWYVVAVAVLVLCGVLAGFVFVWALDRIWAIPEDFDELDGGQATVRLAPDRDATLYASESTNAAAVGEACTVSGPGNVRQKAVTGRKKVTQDSEWTAVSQLQATKAGQYTVSCSSRDGVQYAVGPSVAELSGRTGKAVGGAIGFFLLIGLGLAGSVTIFLVTALRRHGHRKRLLAEAGGPRYGPPR